MFHKLIGQHENMSFYIAEGRQFTVLYGAKGPLVRFKSDILLLLPKSSKRVRFESD